MLAICNGAIKSGSTWLYNILRNLRPFQAPNDDYLTLKSPRHPCIRPDRLEEFLKKENYRDKDYLSKNHLDKPEHRKLLVSVESVYVFDIERDARDVVVSYYYHERLRSAYMGSFIDFYWSVGREAVSGLSRYHALWRDAGPRSYVSSYERLHREFDAEIGRIAAVLGMSLTAEQAAAIREKHRSERCGRNTTKSPISKATSFFARARWVIGKIISTRKCCAT